MPFFFKIGEQEGNTCPIWGWYPWDWGGYMESGCRRLNMVEILDTHAWNWKNQTCWNYSKNGGKGIKENVGGGKFS
jgi:hypothetical protein